MDNKEVKAPSKFAIVNKAVAALNLGDYGKIEGFVGRTADILKREQETAERSIENAKHNWKTELVVLNEELEDAETAVEESYCNLDPEKLKDNAAQRSFREQYLTSLDQAEAVVAGIEAKIEKEKDSHEEKVAKYQKQVDIRVKRIKRLTKGVVTK